MMGAPNIKFRLRVYYKKTGVLAYLSHLEVVRSLEMIVRRSGLPYCVSQGYSPHMKISFGPALAVGIESEKQIFDVYLTKYIREAQALCALKEASKGSLEIVSCEYVDNSAPAASAIFGRVNYSVEVEGQIKRLNVPDEISVIKKGKEKLLTTKDFLIGNVGTEIVDNNTNLSFCLKTKASGSLKPESFLMQVLQSSGCSDSKILSFKII